LTGRETILFVGQFISSAFCVVLPFEVCTLVNYLKP